MRVKRVRHVQIVFVAAEPAESLAVANDFEIGSVNVVPLEHGALVRPKVSTDDSDYTNVGKETRGDGKVRSRASQHLLAFAERRFDCIKGYRPDNEKRHSLIFDFEF